MSLEELRRLLKRVGASPYRKYGHIKIAFEKKIPQEKEHAVLTTISKLANKYSKWWVYPDHETIKEWMDNNYIQMYVCDDPPPEDYNPDTVDGFWIIDYSKKRFLLDFILNDDKIKGIGLYGHNVDVIKKHLPKWFIALTVKKYQDIVESIKQKEQYNESSGKK